MHGETLKKKSIFCILQTNKFNRRRHWAVAAAKSLNNITAVAAVSFVFLSHKFSTSFGEREQNNVVTL